MMGTTISNSDHASWASYKLADYGDFAECVSDCNQRDDYGDSTAGQWFYAPDETITNDHGTFRVIYSGSWGNYNSPGASHYTSAELYDVTDEDELAQFAKDLAAWEACPEWLETDEADEDEADEPEEGDYTTEDHRRFYQFGKLALEVSEDEDMEAALRAHMEREQYWPDVWFISDHGNAHRIEM